MPARISVWSLVEEYRGVLGWRERVLRGGFWALYTCSRGRYPGHLPLAMLAGVLASMSRGVDLGLYDPSAWLYARMCGGPERARESLEKARREVHRVDEEECCCGVEDSVFEAVLMAWRAVRDARRLLDTGSLKPLLESVHEAQKTPS